MSLDNQEQLEAAVAEMQKLNPGMINSLAEQLVKKIQATIEIFQIEAIRHIDPEGKIPKEHHSKLFVWMDIKKHPITDLLDTTKVYQVFVFCGDMHKEFIDLENYEILLWDTGNTIIEVYKNKTEMKNAWQADQRKKKKRKR